MNDRHPLLETLERLHEIGLSINSEWVLTSRFSDWQTDVLDAISAASGFQSELVWELKSIRYYPLNISNDTPDQQFDKSFADGVRRALEIIREAISGLDEANHDEANHDEANHDEANHDEDQRKEVIYKTECSNDAARLQKILDQNEIQCELIKFPAAPLTPYSAPTNNRTFGILIEESDIELTRLILLRENFEGMPRGITLRVWSRAAAILTAAIMTVLFCVLARNHLPPWFGSLMAGLWICWCFFFTYKNAQTLFDKK